MTFKHRLVRLLALVSASRLDRAQIGQAESKRPALYVSAASGESRALQAGIT